MGEGGHIHGLANGLTYLFSVLVILSFVLLGTCWCATRWLCGCISRRRHKQRRMEQQKEVQLALEACVQSLPTRVVANDEQHDVCSVCLEALTVGDQLRVLPCGHEEFHQSCIDTWLLRLNDAEPTCPLCKSPAVVVRRLEMQLGGDTLGTQSPAGRFEVRRRATSSQAHRSSRSWSAGGEQSTQSGTDVWSTK